MMKERESRTASWPVPGNPDPWKDQQDTMAAKFKI
jgi:hypothetical protein